MFRSTEKEYRQALALRPEDTGALFGLALALLANRQTDEALSLAQAALNKHPDDPELNAGWAKSFVLAMNMPMPSHS